MNLDITFIYAPETLWPHLALPEPKSGEGGGKGKSITDEKQYSKLIFVLNKCQSDDQGGVVGVLVVEGHNVASSPHLHLTEVEKMQKTLESIP